MERKSCWWEVRVGEADPLLEEGEAECSLAGLGESLLGELADILLDREGERCTTGVSISGSTIIGDLVPSLVGGGKVTVADPVLLLPWPGGSATVADPVLLLVLP